MKIGRRGRDVAQTGYAQNFRLWRRQRMEYSVALEKIAANVHALVTGDATQRFEQAISVLFFDRQGAGVSHQPAVETAAGRYQRSLEACEGIDDIPGVGAAAVDGHELAAQSGIGVELFRNLGDIGAHDLRILQGSFDIQTRRCGFFLPNRGGS